MSLSDADVDGLVWGKQKGLPAGRTYPAVLHMLDAAAVAGVLWDQLVTDRAARRLARLAGLSVGGLRTQVMFWAGLHDLGKVSPAFLSQVAAAYSAVLDSLQDTESYAKEHLSLRHEVATHWTLPALLAALGYPQHHRRATAAVSHQIAQMLGGHHGSIGAALTRPQLADPVAFKPGLGGGAWIEQRAAHVQALWDLLNVEEIPQHPLPADVAVPVLGLIIIADWLASQTADVTKRLPPTGWLARPEALAEHWRKILAEAPGVVAAAGLGGAEFPALSFTEAFSDFTPNPLQASIAADLPGMVTGPGLVLITAPPGDGKSEAGWFSAVELARASGANGVYWAMPTMSTADPMHERVSGFVTEQVTGAQAVTLSHSMAFLSAAYTAAKEGTVSGGDPTLAAEWLWGPRRPLWARFCVGTIDQVLAGVLPSRFNMLRLAALHGKVLVVDEAHSYGAWMQQLLVRLLEWCGAMGVSVVLMSATLAGRIASPLVAAYRRGAGHIDSVDVAPPYPGWLHVDAATGTVSEPRTVGTDRPRKLVVDLEPVRHAAKPSEPTSRHAVIREHLRPLRDAGEGCAMVVCATVTEAQETWRDLKDWGTAHGVEVRLLHSRFPAWRREQITKDCIAAYGKPQPGAPEKRPASILVATSIVEQSVDLDFDLVISDLAVLALLLQRAGRCWRHERPRPDWAGSPRLVVLDPIGKNGEFSVPATWGKLYPVSLLRRTRALLSQGRTRIDIPGDVQRLVDDVYATDFVDRLESAAAEELSELAAKLSTEDVIWRAEEMAEKGLADIVMIDTPMACQDLSKISLLDGSSVPEDLLTTRLGADSERVVCLYLQSDGRRTLDAAGTIAVPGEPAAPGGRIPRTLNDSQLRAVLNQTIPVPASWLAGVTGEAPAAWDKHAMTRRIIAIEMRPDGESWIHPGGDKPLRIDTACNEGLSIHWTLG